MPLKQAMQTRCDVRRDACTVCVKNDLLPGFKRLDVTNLFDNDYGTLPHRFLVCSDRCRHFFDGEKKLRPVQKEILRRVRLDVLRTSLLPGDIVDVCEDKSPLRYVESGRGTVLRLEYNPASNGATIQVKMSASRCVAVGPDALRLYKKAGDETALPRPSRVPLQPLEVLLERQKERNENQSVAMGAQKRLRVAAEHEALGEKRLRFSAEAALLDEKLCSEAHLSTSQCPSHERKKEKAFAHISPYIVVYIVVYRHISHA
jgi:predicted nucleic acid-binding Zn ribbon protein